MLTRARHLQNTLYDEAWSVKKSPFFEIFQIVEVKAAKIFLNIFQFLGFHSFTTIYIEQAERRAEQKNYVNQWNRI